MKSLRRLIGLFLVSLFLASIWISTVPGVEDPWDENKVSQSDSCNALGHGGFSVPDEPHIGVVIDIMGLLKGYGFNVLLISDLPSAGEKSTRSGRTSLNGARLKIDAVNSGGVHKTRK